MEFLRVGSNPHAAGALTRLLSGEGFKAGGTTLVQRLELSFVGFMNKGL